MRRIVLGKEPAAVKKLGKWLDRAGWTFVLARVQALEWQELDLKEQDMGRGGSAALADSLAQMTSLRKLDARRSGLTADVEAAVASGLTALTRLRELDLRSNGLSTNAWQAAMGGITRYDSPRA